MLFKCFEKSDPSKEKDVHCKKNSLKKYQGTIIFILYWQDKQYGGVQYYLKHVFIL